MSTNDIYQWDFFDEDADRKLNPQFEDHPYKEYSDGSKFRRETHDWLVEDDDSGLDFNRDISEDQPLDNFDGILPPDQVGQQDNMLGGNFYNGTEMQDYSDLYDAHEMSMIAKRARLKVSHIQKGDSVLLMRPFKYDLPLSMSKRIGKVVDTLENGWIVVETHDKEKVAVYCGDSDEDNDVQKIDYDELYEVYGHKIATEDKPLLLRLWLLQHEEQDEHPEEFLEENQHWAHIMKEKGKWVVKDKKKTRSFGSYPTKAEAEKRLQQVHYFARKGEK